MARNGKRDQEVALSRINEKQIHICNQPNAIFKVVSVNLDL